MILSIVGVILMLFGLFAGGTLVVVPLGLAPGAAGPVLWLLFPLLSTIGFMLLAMGARSSDLRHPMRVVSSLLLVLAVASAGGIVLGAADYLQPVGSTLPLWYVMAVAGLIGTIGTASFGKGSQAAT